MARLSPFASAKYSSFFVSFWKTSLLLPDRLIQFLRQVQNEMESAASSGSLHMEIFKATGVKLKIVPHIAPPLLATTDNARLPLLYVAVHSFSPSLRTLIQQSDDNSIVRAMSPALNFLIVSFTPFIHSPKDEQRKVAQQLYDGFSVYGWIHLEDFDISQEEVDDCLPL